MNMGDLNVFIFIYSFKQIKSLLDGNLLSGSTSESPKVSHKGFDRRSCSGYVLNLYV